MLSGPLLSDHDVAERLLEPESLAIRETLSDRYNLARPVSRVTKAMFDVTISAALLLLLSPLMLAIALLIRCDGGPMIFFHERIGAGGRRFRCLKFRTMVPDSAARLQNAIASEPALAAEWVATRKLRNDPRVTPVGRCLRRTSLDELPQLINVLRLDMSLVGPRPIIDEEVPLYGQDIQFYYETRPGLTGLWQVSGRSETSFAERVRLDTRYVRRWTMWRDLAILAKTVQVVLSRKGAH